MPGASKPKQTNHTEVESGLPRARSWPWIAGALAVGLLAALIETFPLPLRLTESIPDCALTPRQGCHDNLLCVWITGEGGRRLYENPLEVFEATIFHPLRHTLAYSESMLSAALFVGPLNAVTGNPVLGYNLYYLATIVVGVLGVFLLVVEIVGDPRAALLGGWLFGLTDERWWYRGRLPAISVHWAPFFLLAWVRFLKRPTFGRATCLALVILAHEHASAYHALVLPVLLVPWAVTLFVSGPWPFRRWVVTSLVVAGALTLSLSLYIPYLIVHQEVPFQPRVLPTIIGIDKYWGGLAELPSVLSAPFTGPRTRVHASPLPLIALVLAAAASLARAKGATVGRRAGEGSLFAAMIAFWISAALISTDPLWPGIDGPLSYLRALPGFSSMRSAARFDILAALGGAVVLGVATAVVFRRCRGRATIALLSSVFAALILIDTRVLRRPMPLRELPAPHELPAVYRWLATTAPGTAVLELPDTIDDDVEYMIHSLYHGRRLTNGYSGIVPRLFRFRPGFPTDEDLEVLREADVRYIIVHRDRLAGRRFGRTILSGVDRRSDLLVDRFDSAMVLEVPAGVPKVETALGDRLESGTWTLTASDPGAERAADGDLASHWTPRPGPRASFLRVDLGRLETVGGITLRLGPHILEYPRAYRISVSDDGETWNLVQTVTIASPPLASYRRDHRNIEMVLRLPPTRTRHLEIRVPAEPAPFRLPLTHPPPNWGVHELDVHVARAPPAGA